MAAKKIRVGIIGVQPGRSWGAVAHIPALQALPKFYEITAVGTTRQESADEAAKYFGIPHAFGHYRALVESPDVDLVAVAVKVPHHLELVTAALHAGKMVYCEWPLGNGLAQATELADLAVAKKLRNVVGLQARFAPPIVYAKDLIAQGYVGEVLSVSLIGSAMNWGAYVDPPNVYTADRDNGATVLTIPLSHTVDAICAMLGEIESLSALLANRRTFTKLTTTAESLPLTAEDQVAFAATLKTGPVLVAHYRGGIAKGTNLLIEINGELGDLRLTGGGGHAQIFDLALSGATGDQLDLQPLPVPAHYYHTDLRSGPAANVAELYAQLAHDISDGSMICPDFHHAVERHRMVAAIELSAANHMQQRL